MTLAGAVDLADEFPRSSSRSASIPTVFTGGQTITLNGSQLELSNTGGPQTITGPGASLLTVSGNDASRVFQVDQNVTASISGLTITGGFVSGSGYAGYGGGILNRGAMTLTNAILSGNTAVQGGGVYNAGTGSQATIAGTTLSDNTATHGFGGGIRNTSSTVTLTDCTISGNSGEGVHASLDSHHHRQHRQRQHVQHHWCWCVSPLRRQHAHQLYDQRQLGRR